MSKPIPEFKAIYNPYIRKLAVLYGNAVIEHTFEDQEEWAVINYNDYEANPEFLHVQLDYDENCQLIFYPRVEGSDELNEDLSNSWTSDEQVSDFIKIVHTDEQYNSELIELNKLRFLLLKNE